MSQQKIPLSLKKGPVREHASEEPRVAAWLWQSSIILLAMVLAGGLALVAALALGWRSPTPRRAPDWLGDDLAWRQRGAGLVTATRDGYQMRLSQPDQRSWIIADQPFANFDLEIDTRAMAANQDVGYGVLFRYQDPENFYLFAIGNDGYYSIALVHDGDLAPLRAWQQWPHVHRGESTNRLRVQCNGVFCRFFINGEFTAEINANTFRTGRVGLWAQNFSNDSLDVVYENIRLWSLE